MMMLALPAAAALLATAQNTPVNRLDFVTGRIAGMGRMIDGFFSCVASINGRPGGPGDLNMCYLITNAGGYEIVRRAGANTQFEAVLGVGVNGAPPPPSVDMGNAVAIASSSARMTLRRDGSIAGCADGPIRIMRRVPGFRDVPPLCETYPPGAERVFTDAPAGGGPRTVRMRIDYYLRRP
jgi:hypothetical protein